MARRQTVLAHTPADGDGLKAYPNGIKVFAQALWQFWPYISGKSSKTRQAVRSFKDYGLNDVAKRLSSIYPSSNIATVSAYKIPYKIGSGGKYKLSNDHGEKEDDGNIELTYMHLRLMADYIDMPVSLLILYTHLISLERLYKEDTSKRHEKMSRLLHRVEVFVAEMRKQISEKRDNTDIFTEIFYDEENKKSEYLANLKFLKEVIDKLPKTPGVET